MNDQNPQWVREPLDIPPHIKYAHRNGRGMLTFYQAEQLVEAVNENYVQRKQGKAYFAQHQARAEMNRIFGYGNWDVIEGEPVLIYELEKESNGTKYIACYRASVTINVRDLWGMPVCTVTGTHAEANANLPDRSEAHAMAITSVLSYALRRALINLGDRFGLGLYNGGSTAAHGQYTIQLEPGQLFAWKDANAATPAAAVPGPNAALPAQPNHHTIQAQPVISDDGTIPEQPVQAPVQQPVQQAPQQGYVPMDAPMDFNEAQARQQAGREQARQQQQQQQPAPQPVQVDPAILARAQGGFKTDGGQG